jgi:hypothetical protein
MARACCALALLMGVTALPGCGAPTNLTQVADRLQSSLMSMPGVTDVWVYHDESYAEGVIFNIAVDVPTATRAQIIAVADRIAATRIDLITSYTQNVEFWVMPDQPVTIRRQSRVDAAQIADDAERLRAIAADTDGRIDWFRGDDGAVNQLSFDESHTAGADILDVVRRTAGDTGVTMSVSPFSPSHRTPRMIVSFPLSAQSQTSALQFIDTVPVDVFGLRIDTGGVRALEAMVPADATVAERELSAVVDSSKAVAAHPMWLAWYVPSAVGGVPVFDGVVEVGDCSAPAAEIRQASRRVNHGGSSTLQARLQSKIDSCAAAEPIPTEWSQSPSETRSPSPTGALPPDKARTPDITRAVDRPTTVSTPCGTGEFVAACPPSTSGSIGNTTSGTPLTRPVRVPSLRGSPAIGPRPAAGIDPTGQPPSGGQSTAPGGPPKSPTTSHGSTTQAARSGR